MPTVTWEDLSDQDRYEREFIALSLWASRSDRSLDMVPDDIAVRIHGMSNAEMVTRGLELDGLITSDILADMRASLRSAAKKRVN